MSLSEVEIVFFLPMVLLLHWLGPRRATWQNSTLLVASWIFYASWSPKLLPILLGATIVDYLLGLYVARHRGTSRARLGLALSLVYNLGQLGFFKYAGFFATELNRLLGVFGLSAPLPVLHVALPLGLSFFTFQKIGYMLDVYDERVEPCRSPLEFATFVAFFPQLIAGPIVRAGEMLPQWSRPRSIDTDAVRRGAGLMLLGYFKKAYVAAIVAREIVDPVFAAHEAYGTAGHWLATIGYAIQVFCDFSGYTDLALGIALLFGIELPKNFDYPFLSTSMMEFWRRWHISLNTWLFDYLYGPMTAGHGWFRERFDAAFMVVFLASGLWHGAAWTFVLWGVLHGIALVVDRRWDELYRGLCRKDRKWVARRKTLAYRGLSWVGTQLFFVVCLVPFRSANIGNALAFGERLFVPTRGTLLGPAQGRMRLLNLAIGAAFVVGYHALELPAFRGLRERFLSLPGPLRGAVYGIVVVVLFLFVPLSSGTFIYAQF